MTTIKYECVDKDGNEFVVNSFPEAEEVKLAGGKYKKVLKQKLSDSEAHCRLGARRAGELR